MARPRAAGMALPYWPVVGLRNPMRWPHKLLVCFGRQGRVVRPPAGLSETLARWPLRMVGMSEYPRPAVLLNQLLDRAMGLLRLAGARPALEPPQVPSESGLQRAMPQVDRRPRVPTSRLEKKGARDSEP
eukprot:1647749-Alexandrium_andersonii.AAC.1